MSAWTNHFAQSGRFVQRRRSANVETLLDLAVQLWWFGLIVAAGLLVRLLAFIHRHRRLVRSGITEIDAMDGPTFEGYL
ncbi:MAG: hypothetical protein H0V94_08985 [Actinobacteria bacterium]|nr:hypothetical protein [Actinomycetota bacterium]